MHKDKNSRSGPCTGQPLREKVHIWLGSLPAANFIYCLCDDSLFVYQKILCVYVLEKVKTFYTFFSHSPTIIGEKYFCSKWTHFRKIYKGRLSFFWYWQHFVDTSRVTKILEELWFKVISIELFHLGKTMLLQFLLLPHQWSNLTELPVWKKSHVGLFATAFLHFVSLL